MKARSKFYSILGLSVALIGLSTASVLAGDKAGKGDKADKGAKIGEAAPAWTAKDIKGKEWKSTDFADKIVVLEWVNPQCPVCKAVNKDGRIGDMVKQLKKNSDVVFLGINSSHFTTAEENEKALKDYGLDYPVLLDVDGKIGNAFGARTTPHVFVIDTKGVLRYKGALDNTLGIEKKTADGSEIQNYALNAVKQIKAGETVAPEYTKSYGCGVKYGSSDGKQGKDKSKTQ